MSVELNEIKLTQYSKGAGCGCKIAPDTLQKILSGQSDNSNFEGLIIGNSTSDDAAVLDQGNDNYLISTTDFFSPIVDDPFDFGRIAAANALSDVYAMGGTPSMALAILGWPVDKLPIEAAREVIRGGRSICLDAGIPLAGGHSIDIPEPVFGLAVNGTVHKANLKTNAGAQAGDDIFLSKPLGLGIMSTAMKRGVLANEHQHIAPELMCQLNDFGASAAQLAGVHSMTDITGFGLFGHLIELCESSGLHATLNRDGIPIIPQAIDYLAKGCYPDGTFRNWRSYGSKVQGAEGNDMLLYSDPQTSGGLLITASPESKSELLKLASQSENQLFHVGSMTVKSPIETVIYLS